MYAVTDTDREYAGRTSGDLSLALALLGRVDAAVPLQERAMLVAEAADAIRADPVGELHAPAAPRRDAFDERIAVIARVPRAATEEHGDLLKFSALWCNGYASLHCDHHDADLRCTFRVGWENLSSVARA